MFNYIGFALIWTSIRNIIKSFLESESNVLPLIYVGGGGKYFFTKLNYKHVSLSGVWTFFFDAELESDFLPVTSLTTPIKDMVTIEGNFILFQKTVMNNDTVLIDQGILKPSELWAEWGPCMPSERQRLKIHSNWELPH